MSDLFSQLDPTFMLYISSIAINILTQIGKPFHKSPTQVFKLVSLVICIFYGTFTYLFGHEILLSIVAKMTQVILLASGAWHLLMRPESEFQKYLKRMLKK